MRCHRPSAGLKEELDVDMAKVMRSRSAESRSRRYGRSQCSGCVEATVKTSVELPIASAPPC